MKFAKGMTLLALALSAHTTFAAEQSIATDSTLHVQADPTLKTLLPADIIKRGYIVAGTNPNTPPTTFFQEDNKTLAGREIDIMNADVIPELRRRGLFSEDYEFTTLRENLGLPVL